MNQNSIKQIVKEHYSEIAINNKSGCCTSCGCGDVNANEQIAESIGYSHDEIKLASDANLGLGCGNPTGMGNIREGEVVLDLGSGAGFDCFLAARKVGEHGRVIGVDMSEEMIERAKINANKYGYKNVDFRLGDIENLPIENNSVDVVISNCVINLAPNKQKVFKEAYRVLRKGGKMYISDIVLLKGLSEEQKNDENLIAGCVGGALLKDDYLDIIRKTGFEVNILYEDVDISKRQYHALPLESLKIEAQKQ